ncbi:MAG: PorT family protein [Bacteroidota bacterium]|nr:PorT family protein [Bacteroidota bacterium]
MKKLLAIAFFAGTFITAKSQVYVQGGVNLANITKNKSGGTSSNNLLTTFNAGVLGRFNLSDVFDLETGLLLDGRGSKTNNYLTSSTDDNYIKSKFNPLYLEVPLNLVVRFPLEKKTSLFVNAGPYVAMGIAGKSKVDTKAFGISSTSTNDIKFTSTDPTADNQGAYDRLKRFDYGVNLGAGVDLGRLLLKVNYGLGLEKINSTQTNNSADAKNKYRTLSISLGIPIAGGR